MWWSRGFLEVSGHWGYRVWKRLDLWMFYCECSVFVGWVQCSFTVKSPDNQSIVRKTWRHFILLSGYVCCYVCRSIQGFQCCWYSKLLSSHILLFLFLMTHFPSSATSCEWQRQFFSRLYQYALMHGTTIQTEEQKCVVIFLISRDCFPSNLHQTN